MAGKLVSEGFVRFVLWEVKGSNPMDSQYNFYIWNNDQRMSDTWRPQVGPLVLILFAHNGHVSTCYSPTSTKENAPHHPPAMSPYGWYDPAMSPYGQVQSASKKISYLAWRTDRDIFSIRTPFEKENIPLESGRRDRRNGTVFVTFRALWKLSKIWSPDQSRRKK